MAPPPSVSMASVPSSDVGSSPSSPSSHVSGMSWAPGSISISATTELALFRAHVLSTQPSPTPSSSSPSRAFAVPLPSSETEVSAPAAIAAADPAPLELEGFVTRSTATAVFIKLFNHCPRPSRPKAAATMPATACESTLPASIKAARLSVGHPAVRMR